MVRSGRDPLNTATLAAAPNARNPVRSPALSASLHIYGIRNCDTMKKARSFLDARGRAYVFHDYKIEGVTPEKLKDWSSRVGWEVLLNRAGTTFRKMPDADRQDLIEQKAIALMAAQPSLIKRPVLEAGGALLVGFKPAEYERI